MVWLLSLLVSAAVVSSGCCGAHCTTLTFQLLNAPPSRLAVVERFTSYTYAHVCLADLAVLINLDDGAV